MKIQLLLPTGPVWDAALSYFNSWRRLGYRPRLKEPRTFNEFFLREKIRYKTDPVLAQALTDKAEFKGHLAKIGLESSIVPTLHLFESADGLAGKILPAECVIKPTHGSGDLLLIREEMPRELSTAELLMLGKWLTDDYYVRGREPNYKGLKPRIIVEPMLKDSEGNPPKDFKVFCVHGEPFVIQVDHDRFSAHTRQLYTPDWQLTDYTMYYPKYPVPMPKPRQLERAFDICKRLGSSLALSRVDFYFVGDSEVFVGELTFFPGNCAEPFYPAKGDFILGDRIRELWQYQKLPATVLRGH